ncbi:hypothetical protein FSHL1_007133 [Fusarium sambucinum]
MEGLDSSVVTQPFNLSVVTGNGTDQLRTLVAPSWVSSPNVRGTFEILQSCILTLVACIYTALHLDVPKKTTWQHLLWQKFKWSVLTLFAPEVAVFVAAMQLRYAWNLKLELLKIRNQRRETLDFEIDLRYAFFIVMGAVRFDVHDILSFNDLNASYREHFQETDLNRRSIRSAPASIIFLAKQGQWIKIRKQDIDDKSKANTIQKVLVLIQVLWMVTQCMTRHISDLPISLLEIHTIVHVVCAVLLYTCWFKKPLDVQEAIVIPTEKFRLEIATMLQRHFYSGMSYKMAVFPPRRNGEQPPTDADGSQMRWISHQPGATMREGDILPSGLALCKNKVEKLQDSSMYELDPQSWHEDVSFVLEPQFLNRWSVIFNAYPFEGRATDEFRIVIRRGDGQHDEPRDGGVLYLAMVKELELREWGPDGERLFWETESIFHLHWGELSEMGKKKDLKKSIRTSDLTFWSWEFIVLAMLLAGLYGGVHLSMGQACPSYDEGIIWKVSCFILIFWLPVVLPLHAACLPIYMAGHDWRSEDGMVRAMKVITFYVMFLPLLLFLLTSLSLAYISARVFIIVESFLCLRRSPVGVFVSPEWLELFPHF